MRRKKSGTGLILTGLLLIAAALFLTLGNWREDRSAGEAAVKVMEIMERELTKSPESEKGEPAAIPTAPPEQPGAEAQTMATLTIEDHEYIGFLELPSQGKQLPVMADWSYPQLEIAPCVFSGSLCTDDLVIAGHNYASHFGWIWFAGPNEEIRLITADKQLLRYVVDYVETIGPDDADYLTEKTDWDLSLFTCTTGGTNRRVLRCIRME